jgi:hypothetical protein
VLRWISEFLDHMKRDDRDARFAPDQSRQERHAAQKKAGFS